MIDEVRQLLEDYMTWLRDKTSIKEVDDWAEITTPYLDRHNDWIQIYAQKADGGYLLTDDGYTVRDLRISGCPLDTAKRKEILQMILNGFGVEMNRDSIEIYADKGSFALKKHNLVQAILAVNNMFYLASPTVESLDTDDEIHICSQVRGRIESEGWCKYCENRLAKNN